MKRQIRVRDLPESGNGHGVMLYCRECQGEYSPDRGDYFMRDGDAVMLCCDEPLRLVQKRTSYVQVARGDLRARS